MQNWDADLASLLKAILAPCGREERIDVRGPSIKLAENAAMAFSIATHELATNVTKYGSLSRIDGTLNVAWDVKRNGGDGRIFSMRWIESGGPKSQRRKRSASAARRSNSRSRRRSTGP